MYCSAGNIEMLSLKDFFLLYLKKQKYWNYEYMKIIYVNCGVKNCVKEDLCSYISILCSWKPEKRDSNPWPLRQNCYSTKLIMKCPLCIKQNFMKSNSVCNSSTGLACTQTLFCFSFRSFFCFSFDKPASEASERERARSARISKRILETPHLCSKGALARNSSNKQD